MSHPREPVPQTCPDIDKVIKALNSIEKLCNYKSYEEIDDLRTRIDNIGSELWNTVDILESLRKDNDALRSWGKEEARMVDSYEQQLLNGTINI